MVRVAFGILYRSWEIDGETVETVSDFIFGGSKITADGEHAHQRRENQHDHNYLS